VVVLSALSSRAATVAKSRGNADVTWGRCYTDEEGLQVSSISIKWPSDSEDECIVSPLTSVECTSAVSSCHCKITRMLEGQNSKKATPMKGRLKGKKLQGYIWAGPGSMDKEGKLFQLERE
jgi:hypothetical protein